MRVGWFVCPAHGSTHSAGPDCSAGPAHKPTRGGQRPAGAPGRPRCVQAQADSMQKRIKQSTPRLGGARSTAKCSAASAPGRPRCRAGSGGWHSCKRLSNVCGNAVSKIVRVVANVFDERTWPPSMQCRLRPTAARQAEHNQTEGSKTAHLAALDVVQALLVNAALGGGQLEGPQEVVGLPGGGEAAEGARFVGAERHTAEAQAATRRAPRGNASCPPGGMCPLASECDPQRALRGQAAAGAQLCWYLFNPPLNAPA